MILDRLTNRLFLSPWLDTSFTKVIRELFRDFWKDFLLDCKKLIIPFKVHNLHIILAISRVFFKVKRASEIISLKLLHEFEVSRIYHNKDHWHWKISRACYDFLYFISQGYAAMSKDQENLVRIDMLVFIFVFFFSSSVPSTLDNFSNDIQYFMKPSYYMITHSTRDNVCR